MMIQESKTWYPTRITSARDHVGKVSVKSIIRTAKERRPGAMGSFFETGGPLDAGIYPDRNREMAALL